MFRLHSRDGRTASVDLTDADQAREWLTRLSREDVQLDTTGVTVDSEHGFQLNVPRSDGFDRQLVRIERQAANQQHRGFERVVLFAGDVRLMVTCHADSPAARITLSRVGRMKYSPKR